ncbi:tyrosine-protein phosphatase [Phytohabitans sp. ZYX-F-186]|uniref:Tyrosine-protein phosphatase n=1 Tax=Phytohabitans maris TaxID=3071409 RepID=A0ABU0ZRQ3_9ACTN|nr:tyrosine-protein phosphatase [Phytohabitans sp. ZYX-F-186]MDQ7909167.1 tyrosine-protein phosphatase [Phytohabitans sp. ZYX-F-186]
MDRTLPFTTTFNFRDVGGYLGHDGRPVRWRRLFRSDSLHRLDGGDTEAFAALGVRTVIDLRRPREVTRDGRVPAYVGLGYRHIHPEHQDWDEIPFEEEVGVARYLANRYHDLAEQGAAGICAAVGVIADEGAAPVVVHCVAGKDRTGVVCALTLSALGVSDQDIAADYALSTAASVRFTEFLRSRAVRLQEVPRPYFSSPAEAMLLFLRELRERHGSAEGYLLAAGITPEQLSALRTHLLS